LVAVFEDGALQLPRMTLQAGELGGILSSHHEPI